MFFLHTNTFICTFANKIISFATQRGGLYGINMYKKKI